MIQIGRHTTLPVLSMNRSGAVLGTEDENVFLPAQDLPQGLEVGHTVRVFVYTDSEDQPVATTMEPFAVLGDFAYLKVVDVSPHGAFLDWGLRKDLFVPFKNQFERMEVGRAYVVGLRIHARTQRMVGASILSGMFDDDVSKLAVGDEVDLLVYGSTDRGTQVVVNNKHAGLVYRDQTFRPLKNGDQLKGWIQVIRDDHRLDITLQRRGRQATDDAEAVILAALEEAGGRLALHDKSPPEEIQAALQMSKKAFKKAIGGLYKKRLITVSHVGIRRQE